jgi:hypothetical protein
MATRELEHRKGWRPRQTPCHRCLLRSFFFGLGCLLALGDAENNAKLLTPRGEQKYHFGRISRSISIFTSPEIWLGKTLICPMMHVQTVIVNIIVTSWADSAPEQNVTDPLPSSFREWKRGVGHHF